MGEIGLESGVFRADIANKFKLDPTARGCPAASSLCLLALAALLRRTDRSLRIARRSVVACHFPRGRPLRS